jgi:hypothetical protein
MGATGQHLVALPASRESGRKLVGKAPSLSFRAVVGTNDRVELEVAFWPCAGSSMHPCAPISSSPRLRDDLSQAQRFPPIYPAHRSSTWGNGKGVVRK